MSGLSFQQLEAGFRFSGQRLRLCHASEPVEPLPLEEWSVTRPWPFGFAEKTPTDMERSETIKYLLGGKIVCVNRHWQTKRVRPLW